jgi:hypothetical protein
MLFCEKIYLNQNLNQAEKDYNEFIQKAHTSRLIITYYNIGTNFPEGLFQINPSFLNTC